MIKPVSSEQRAQYRKVITAELDKRIDKNQKFIKYAEAFDIVWRGNELAGTKPFGPNQIVTLEQAVWIEDRKRAAEEDLEYCWMLQLCLQDEWAMIDQIIENKKD